MRSNQIVWTGLARRPGVAVLLVMLVGAEIGLADRFPPDPVEELRQTLKTAAFEADLAELQRDLPKRVEALRTLSDMYRALALEEWPQETYVPGWRPRPDWDKFEAERWETWSKEGDNKIVTTKWQARIRLAQSFESKARALLKSGTTSVRLALLDLLAETGPSMSIVDYPEPLLKGYRKGVARALSPDIAALVNDADSPPQVRETAARTLSQIFPDPDVAVAALRQLLASRSVGERRATVRALVALVRTVGQLASKSQGTTTGLEAELEDVIQVVRAVVPLASRGLSDSDLDVRRLSAEAMLQTAVVLDAQVPQPQPRIEETKAKTESKPLVRDPAAFLPAMETFKEQMTALGKALTDPDVEVRLSTQRALEELGLARLRLLRGPDANLGPAGAAAPPDPLLEKLGDLLPPLQAQLRDPNVQVRLGAVDVLETFGSVAAPAAPALIQALGDPHRFVRWAAARTLGKLSPIEPATAAPALGRLLLDEDLDVRLSASVGTNLIGTPLRATATGALNRYGPAAADAVPDLIQAMKAGDADTRDAVIRTLVAIGTRAQPAVPALAAALSDPDPRVRQTAAEALGRFGSLAASAEPALSKALDDSNADVRKAASDALLIILQAGK